MWTDITALPPNLNNPTEISSVQFSRSVVANSLRSRGLQHARLSCPSPKLPELAQTHVHRVSDAIPFSSCLQSFQASGSFPLSWLFASGGQSIGASASVLPMTIQGSFPLRLTGLILLCKGLSRVFSSTTVQKHHLFSIRPSLWPKRF